ncbi:hypothetical protein K504DRAFT_170792 [Pleomassaria siparia CBS 279.74]|uniref:BZIP domain-containing protein n=1 Tax=Pleomassaria siparia CBS 279.74 TaxID=1314801 RepID=A0A6G1JSZ8_9PLEO|nr:hypothetical protein K504DRAFT_170792 [Pleomassaria siparia CBS 279.74]
MTSLPSNLNHDVVSNGSYCAWLHPYVEPERNNVEEPVVEEPTSVPVRRGRGRPRVSMARDASAIEKRRAQVRNAQRAYQERKDGAMTTKKQKCSAILQVLSELSIEVEELLRLASIAGNLDRDDDVGAQMRRVKTTFDEATKRPCVAPELKQVREANLEKRRTDEEATNSGEDGASTPNLGPALPENRTVDLDMTNIRESTLIGTYSRTLPRSHTMAGKGIFQIVSERQAAMRNAERSPNY